jgi:uncharacterized protein (TIGR02246 family)
MMTAIRGKTARSPEECDHLLGEFLAAGDLDAIVELYEAGACFVTETREVRNGRDAIRQAFGDLAAAKPRLHSTIVRTLRNGDNLAVLYNDWTMTIAGPDGKPIEMTGKAIETVCRQADGSWRFAVDDPFGRM